VRFTPCKLKIFVINQLLQLASEVTHRSNQLILLSRIDGDAPRATNISAGRFWIVREQASVKTFEAAP
jgi:hypothetical protein